MILSAVAVAGVGIHTDTKKPQNKLATLIYIISTLSLVITAFAGLVVPIEMYPLFNRPIEVKRGNIFLYKKPPKYYQYPPKQYLSDVKTHNYANNETENGAVAKKGKIMCYFNAKYYDIQRPQLVDFQCSEDALKKGFCIFHEDDAKGKENELDKTINEKINKLIDDGQEVFCIGYKIPFVSFRGKKIWKPIYFHDSVITIADFSDAFFTEEATAYFVHTSFEEASFDNAVFHGHVLFNMSTFSRESRKQGFFHEWSEDYNLGSNYSGYADFRNTEFHGYADFDNAVFRGIAFFDDAKFFDDAIFTNSRFDTDKDKLTLDKASYYGKFYNKGIRMTNAYIPRDDG